tara:strand:- start:705 stop:1232 length:528 start_codon:yes stop_codon:yes gene_type:complete
MRNEMAKRVSLRYARQKNLSGITFSEGDWHIGTLTIDVLSFVSDTLIQQKVGEIVGSLDTVREIEFDSEDEEVWACREDITLLLEKYPKLVVRGLVTVVDVEESWLNEDFWGRGIGTAMYLNLIEKIWEKTKKPFLFIPNYCNEGSTSDYAQRVWYSLARKFPSEGECLAILKKP